MRLSVYLSDGGTLDIEDFDDDSALDLTEALTTGEQSFARFVMDDATVLVNVAHIVRVDIE